MPMSVSIRKYNDLIDRHNKLLEMVEADRVLILFLTETVNKSLPLSGGFDNGKFIGLRERRILLGEQFKVMP